MTASENNPPHLQIGFTLHPGRVLAVLVALATVMAPIGYVVHRYIFLSGGIESARLGTTLSRFGVNYETSVPTWFSAVLLLLASGAVLLCYRMERALGRPTRFFWLGLTLLLLAMSIDEVASFHENFSYIIERYTGYQGSGVFKYRWVLVGIPVVVLVALLSLPFLTKLRRQTALLLVASGVVYFGGSVGLEMVASYIRDIDDGQKSASFHLVSMIEEYFEMVGACLMCYTALDFLRSEQAVAALQDQASEYPRKAA